MNDEIAIAVVQKIMVSIFGNYKTSSLEEILNRYAFDIKLPEQVIDSTTGETTWAASTNPMKYITEMNMEQKDRKEGWMQKGEIANFDDIIKLWEQINYRTTERVYNSMDVAKSDTIYGCEKVYRSLDSRNSKNLIFCDGVGDSEYVLASERSANCRFCIRIADSANCTNSYAVACSNTVSNSFFIEDCSNVHECIFCAHVSNKQYCIGNVQLEKEQYEMIKKKLIEWMLEN